MGKLLPDIPEDIKEAKDDTTGDGNEERVRNPRDLATSLNLFALVLLIAIVTGTLLDVSVWMFFPATVVLLYVGYYATMRIVRARKVEVKVIEAAFLGALIPLLAVGSLLSFFYFHNSPIKSSILFIPIIPPHIALLIRTRREINHPFLLALSSCLVIASVVTIGFTYELRLDVIMPTITLAIYAMIVMFGAIFMMREKIPIISLKWVSLGLVVFCVASIIVSWFLAIHLFYGLIAATIASVLIFAYLDLLEYQMQTPLSMWTYESFQTNICRVTIKLLTFVVVALWGTMGLMQEKFNAIDEIRNSTFAENSTECDDSERDWTTSTVVIGAEIEIIIFIHWLRLKAKYAMRRNDPYVAESQPMNKRIAIRICGIFAVAALMVCCYICMVLLPIIPVPLGFIAIGSLFLILTDLLHSIRAFLLRFNQLLTSICFGLGFALLLGYFLLPKIQDDDKCKVIPSWVRMVVVTVWVFMTLSMHFFVAGNEQLRKKEQARRARLNDPFHSKWASF